MKKKSLFGCLHAYTYYIYTYIEKSEKMHINRGSYSVFEDTSEAFVFFYFSCLLYKFSDLVYLNLYFLLVTNNQGKGLLNREGTLPSKKKGCCCHFEVNKGKAQRSEVTRYSGWARRGLTSVFCE